MKYILWTVEMGPTNQIEEAISGIHIWEITEIMRVFFKTTNILYISTISSFHIQKVFL